MFQGFDRKKLIKSILIIVILIVVVGILAHVHRNNSMTLSDYEKMQESAQKE